MVSMALATRTLTLYLDEYNSRKILPKYIFIVHSVVVESESYHVSIGEHNFFSELLAVAGSYDFICDETTEIVLHSINDKRLPCKVIIEFYERPSSRGKIWKYISTKSRYNEGLFPRMNIRQIVVIDEEGRITPFEFRNEKCLGQLKKKMTVDYDDILLISKEGNFRVYYC